MIRYFIAKPNGRFSCFPESISIGTEITIYDRPTPFKTTIQNIGLNTQFEIPPFPSSELEMIKNSMSIHYDNVWICINAPYDVIGCIGFNEKTR